MKNLYKYFTSNVRNALQKIEPSRIDTIQELRLNVGQAVAIKTIYGIYYLGNEGELSQLPKITSIKIEQNAMTQIFTSLCEYSVQSYKNELIRGFITVPNGHRVGISGTFVCDGKIIKNVTNITGITLRIARQIDGIGKKVLSRCYDENISSLLVVGAPNTGKTTLIRDIIRQLGMNRKITVIDERGEISAEGHYDLGALTHVYNLCPKSVGISIAVKTSSPEIIVCDEIGADDEVESIIESLNSGVKFICSMHAQGYEQLLKKRSAKLLLDSGCFDYIVLLSNKNKPCEIVEIIAV